MCGRGPLDRAAIRKLKPFSTFICVEGHTRLGSRAAFRGENRVLIDDARFSDLRFIAMNLREEDKRELSVTRDVQDSDGLAVAAHGCFYKKVAIWGRQPHFAFGANWTNEPGRVHVWGFGTASALHVLKPVTRHIKRVMIPEIVSQGALVAQAVSHPANETAHRWLQCLGFSSKATISGVGARKEDMVLFTASADDFRRTLPASLAA